MAISFRPSTFRPTSSRTGHRRPVVGRRGLHLYRHDRHDRHVVSSPRPSDQVLDALGPIHDLHR